MLLILRTGTRKKKIQIVKEKKEGDGYDETETAVVLAHLCPHRSRGERFRDSILRRLDSPLFQYAGMIVFVGVIADGAFFFFLLMGWQTLCRPRTDCDPRNGWFNLSIQILNALFTYMALVSVPWRTANFIHLTKWSCPIRSHEPGCNFYGLPDPELWFHISIGRRLGITIVLLCNCLFQFINHGTRLYYYSYSRQRAYPGNIWTTVFFAASFCFAGLGGVWLGYEASRLRKAFPGKFGHGPIDTLKHAYRERFSRCTATNSNGHPDNVESAAENEESGVDEIEQEHSLPFDESYIDPTRDKRRRVVLAQDRAALRMFAM